MKKFELTSEFITNIFGTKLFRIKALIEFGNVKAGELGGFVEKEENDIVNITLHFFLKDVRSMLPPAVNHSTSVS